MEGVDTYPRSSFLRSCELRARVMTLADYIRACTSPEGGKETAGWRPGPLKPRSSGRWFSGYRKQTQRPARPLGFDIQVFNWQGILQSPINSRLPRWTSFCTVPTRLPRCCASCQLGHLRNRCRPVPQCLRFFFFIFFFFPLLVKTFLFRLLRLFMD